MILKKQLYYDGENEKKKVTIMQENDKNHWTCFVKTKGNGHVSVFEANGQDLRATVNMLTDIFKIPISIED